MVEINGKPILEHNILLLKRYGITDIYINLHHQPDVIREHFGNGKKYGVNIKYSYEETLLGTAGAVRKIADEYWDRKECFILLYGDNLYEYDLREIINFHMKKKGIVTVAVYEKDNVSQSGIVVLDKDNKILKFIEKPKPEEAVSNLVNTGIYILEPDVLAYIPPGKTLDFGKDVFPELIEKGEDIFGVMIKGKLIAIDTPELLKEALRTTKTDNG
jgi:NDP-sugar pyrophosphorylase family protein